MVDAARVFFDWNYEMRQNLRPHNILCLGLVFEAPEYWLLEALEVYIRALENYRYFLERDDTAAFEVGPSEYLPPASGYTATLSAVSGDRRLAVLTLCNNGDPAGYQVDGSENFNMLVAWDGLRCKMSNADPSAIHLYRDEFSCERVQGFIGLSIDYFQNLTWIGTAVLEDYETLYSGLSTDLVSGDYRSGLTN